MVFIIILLGLVALLYIFMQQAPFGKLPGGERLDRIKKSPNYRDGQFQNLNNTPALTEGVSYFAVLKEFLFVKKERKIPHLAMPSEKTDLRSLAPDENVIVWFGHSSYFLQVDGKKMLVDPVFSSNASPLSFTTKSFDGSNIYTTDDIPDIDILFISHDHWDHLDYRTMMKLKSKIKKIICGLGVGQHFERWGFHPGLVIEKDWNEKVEIDEGFHIDVLPARHFSGRGFTRNNAMWVSFALTTPSMKLYLGGDSGYDDHFRRIGETHGPFDLAILECGQYDKSWKYIHMMPEEVVQAALDLDASKLMPVHWGKFSLSNHAWDEPIIRVANAAADKGLPLITPLIGERVELTGTRAYKAWWTAFEK